MNDLLTMCFKMLHKVTWHFLPKVQKIERNDCKNQETHRFLSFDVDNLYSPFTALKQKFQEKTNVRWWPSHW